MQPWHALVHARRQQCEMALRSRAAPRPPRERWWLRPRCCLVLALKERGLSSSLLPLQLCCACTSTSESSSDAAAAAAAAAALRSRWLLRLPVAMLATRLAWVETVVEAALEGSRQKFVQALVLDGAVSSLAVAEQLADELLQVQAAHLPQF